MEISDPITSVLSNKSPKLWTANPDDTVFHTIEKMSEHNVGALPVIEDDKLIGIISERDYTRNVILKGHSSHDTVVRSIMTSSLVTITPADSVAKSLQTMTEKHVRHLPVMDGDTLVGIVTIGDLVKWIISAQDVVFVIAPVPFEISITLVTCNNYRSLDRSALSDALEHIYGPSQVRIECCLWFII